MLKKLTDQVWFGNWQAPQECLGEVGTIINVAHNFSKRRGRSGYWADLRNIPHEVFYVRLALKDRQDVSHEYLTAFFRAVDSAVTLGKLPILTHCQMGGHRGPTSALLAAWHLAGRSKWSLENLHDDLVELSPGIVNGRNYYQSSLAYMHKNCVPNEGDADL